MEIYISHPTSIDYEQELYAPLQKSELAAEHTLVFPHADSRELFDSKTFFQTSCDLVIAEVSEPSLGVGIELGWADEANVAIICIHRKGSTVSGSVYAVTETLLAYNEPDEIGRVISDHLRHQE